MKLVYVLFVLIFALMISGCSIELSKTGNGVLMNREISRNHTSLRFFILNRKNLEGLFSNIEFLNNTCHSETVNRFSFSHIYLDFP